MTGHFYSDVINCARCGETHRHVYFQEFTHQPEPYTHWGMCSKTGEPILMIVQPTNEQRLQDGIRSRKDGWG